MQMSALWQTCLHSQWRGEALLYVVIQVSLKLMFKIGQMNHWITVFLSIVSKRSWGFLARLQQRRTFLFWKVSWQLKLLYLEGAQMLAQQHQSIIDRIERSVWNTLHFLLKFRRVWVSRELHSPYLGLLSKDCSDFLRSGESHRADGGLGSPQGKTQAQTSRQTWNGPRYIHFATWFITKRSTKKKNKYLNCPQVALPSSAHLWGFAYFNYI